MNLVNFPYFIEVYKQGKLVLTEAVIVDLRL